MFFTASKIFWLLAAPSTALSLALVGTLAWAAIFISLRRLPCRSIGIATGLAAALLILGLTPLGEAPLRRLEAQYPIIAVGDLPERLTGIIVLGGGMNLPLTTATGQPQWGEAGDRIAWLLLLAAARRDLRLVFTGGDGALRPTGGSEAGALARWLVDIGFDTGRILFENASRNTAENARFTAELLGSVEGSVPGRWLLVTSAFHMPRAARTFRTQGFDVLPFPVDYRTGAGTRSMGTVADGLRLFDVGVREWIGLWAYRAAGYASASPSGSSSAAGSANR